MIRLFFIFSVCVYCFLLVWKGNQPALRPLFCVPHGPAPPPSYLKSRVWSRLKSRLYSRFFVNSGRFSQFSSIFLPILGIIWGFLAKLRHKMTQKVRKSPFSTIFSPPCKQTASGWCAAPAHALARGMRVWRTHGGRNIRGILSPGGTIAHRPGWSRKAAEPRVRRIIFPEPPKWGGSRRGFHIRCSMKNLHLVLPPLRGSLHIYTLPGVPLLTQLHPGLKADVPPGLKFRSQCHPSTPRLRRDEAGSAYL